MKITAITAACYRPEAWVMSEKYMARQTRQPDQWLVLDGDEQRTTCTAGQEYYHFPGLVSMKDKISFALSSGMVKGDAVIFWENDDYYFPSWIEWCERRLDRYDIVGQGNALYYHVGQRWWSECKNTRHASLCNTAIRSELLEPLYNLIQGFDNQFFDTRLWRLNVRRDLHLPTDGQRLVIGLKGLPGLRGYSAEHSQVNPPGVTSDLGLLKLWKTIGSDAAKYAGFYTHEKEYGLAE